MPTAAAARRKDGPRTLTDLPPVIHAGPRPAETGGEPPRRRRLLPVLIVAVALLVVGGGIAIGAIWSQRSGTEEPVAAPTTSAEAPAPTTTTAPPPTTTARPPTTTTTTTPPASGEAVSFVQSYYALLPDDPDAAFALLSSQAQQASGGIDGYRGFYGGMSAVTVQNARETGQDQVSATIVFTRDDGSTSSEPYTFRVGTGEDGNRIIQSFSRA
jgi:eukaryotic-like serine/threonine-protein kinase